MTRYFSFIRSAKTILAEYSGTIPFANFLKGYFIQNKKFGSTDRRLIAGICYSVLRTGRALNMLEWEEKVKTALFLCSGQPSEVLAFLNPEWNEWLSETRSHGERLAFVKAQYPSFLTEDIFPCTASLSTLIRKESFIPSHLIQPDLFLRIRPGYQEKVIRLLNEVKAGYILISPSCLQLPIQFRVADVFGTGNEVVVQDLSSQRLGELISIIPRPSRDSLLSVWDCCAGSGGKSILARDVLGEIRLTVSDKRESILKNLKKRFHAAGIGYDQSVVADLESRVSPFPSESFDIILADVPCSGSGTWGRAPEHLSQFNCRQIEQYRRLQQKILTHALPCLKKGGYLLYSTCSVFREENEEMVTWIQKNFSLKLFKMEYLEGFERRADTLFAALLIAL